MSVYVFYAIEEDALGGTALIRRSDETGYGSPLLFGIRGDAERVIAEIEEESGCYGEMRVVEMRGESPGTEVENGVG